MQLSYWSSTPGSHLRLPDWPSKLKTLSMLELVTLVMTLYGVVYSSPAGAQCHLGMAATTHGSLQKGKKKKTNLHELLFLQLLLQVYLRADTEV